MTVETSWLVRIGYYDDGTTFTRTDFTNRTLGFSVAQATDLATIGTSTARITLDNSDGELTPQAGGTYSSTQWFKYALEIRCQIDYGAGLATSVDVFAGIIDSFDLTDDGISSTVTIGAVDVFQSSSRQQVETYGNSFVGGVDTAIRDLADPSNFFNNTVMPNFGETARPDGNITVVDKSTSIPVSRLLYILGSAVSASPIGDYLANNIVTCGLTAVWPGGFASNTGHQDVYVVQDARRDDLTTFQFAEDAAGTELPFRALKRTFQLDQLTTAARITRADTSYVATSEAAQSTYGSRLREYVTASRSDSDTDEDAANWTLRFANPRYATTSLQVTAAMVKERASDSHATAWADLLSVENGIWAGASVEFTPAGRPGAITDHALVVGRTITATPSDTTVTLALRPSIDYGTFTLDSAALGIIGINRLG
jgi:hypothetical protein